MILLLIKDNIQNELVKMLPELKIDPTVQSVLLMLLSNKQMLKSLLCNNVQKIDYSNQIKAIENKEHNPDGKVYNQLEMINDIAAKLRA